jgi:regulator of PEP synthase PpsR (kinase-PPPase family)
VSESGAKKVFIVSDATGETAEKVTQAALLQFPAVRPRLRYFVKVRSVEEIDRIVEKARKEGAFIAYTIVDPELRSEMVQRADALDVECQDIIGVLILKLSQFFEVKPAMQSGLRNALDEAYFRRIEAVEFAVKADDGQELRNLKKADLILVGLSRTSKTPLSTYLAQRGFKVANVPLVPDVPPPDELFDVDPRQVHALMIDLPTLLRIRRQRLKHLGVDKETTYATRGHVAKELRWCQALYRAHPEWTVHEVTGRAVEETASAILEVHRRFFPPPENEGAPDPAPEGS